MWYIAASVCSRVEEVVPITELYVGVVSIPLHRHTSLEKGLMLYLRLSSCGK